MGRRHQRKYRRQDPPPWRAARDATKPRHWAHAPQLGARGLGGDPKEKPPEIRIPPLPPPPPPAPAPAPAPAPSSHPQSASTKARSYSLAGQATPKKESTDPFENLRRLRPDDVRGYLDYSRCLQKVWPRAEQWASRLPEVNSGKPRDARPQDSRSYLAYLGQFSGQVPENVARPPGPYPAIEEGALGAPDSEDTLESRPDRRAQLARFVQVVRAHEEESKKKKEEHEKAWANAPAPAIPEEPPFEDDEDLEKFFASRNVQTPLQRFDQLQADNAVAAAKKVLDEKEAERLRLIDKAAADAAVDAARKAILARLDAEEAAAAAAPAQAAPAQDVVMADAPPVPVPAPPAPA